MSRSAPQIDFAARVPQEDFEEFRENFPMHGAVAWFIRSSLSNFNEQIRQQPKLKEVIGTAIRQTIERSAASYVGADE